MFLAQADIEKAVDHCNTSSAVANGLGDRGSDGFVSGSGAVAVPA